MLSLSELRGFIVCGCLFGKICGKISAENRKRNPFPMKLWGGVICRVVECGQNV